MQLNVATELSQLFIAHTFQQDRTQFCIPIAKAFDFWRTIWRILKIERTNISSNTLDSLARVNTDQEHLAQCLTSMPQRRNGEYGRTCCSTFITTSGARWEDHELGFKKQKECTAGVRVCWTEKNNSKDWEQTQHSAKLEQEFVYSSRSRHGRGYITF